MRCCVWIKGEGARAEGKGMEEVGRLVVMLSSESTIAQTDLGLLTFLSGDVRIACRRAELCWACGRLGLYCVFSGEERRGGVHCQRVGLAEKASECFVDFSYGDYVDL